jgi:hypothetical protein
MPEVQVGFLLPSFLRVAAGVYRVGSAAETLEIVAPELVEGLAPRTQVRARFTHPETADRSEILGHKTRDANHLLERANRLLRWYRTVTHRAEMVELTRAQASPFQFALLTVDAPAIWALPLKYESTGPPPLDLPSTDVTERVRAGLASGSEPDVAELFLLDAELALYQGRFREAVLFCWSTIDSVFNRKYDALVNVVLAREWASAREFFTGPDFGLRNKMTAGMTLLGQQSLFHAAGDLWERMSQSYGKRNRIIHRGESAAEDEARQAIAVARQVVQVLNAIVTPSVASPALAPPPIPPPAPTPTRGGATGGRKKKGK